MMRRSAELTVMRAATEALAPHGITTVHELKSVTWCYDPTVIEAIEDAVHNTFEDRLPPACYRTLS
ncbi:hypothetical protein [Salisaeta longa]|uniref:hypothetical protein n=1 Tax=Salisaeta longa TaxID=503170 RepID=UPI0003B4FB22|nr:hypothetical protein [Salisaeta longa]